MDRSNEEKWKLDPRSYRANILHIDRIKLQSPHIAQEFGFKTNYDLADELIGVLRKYLFDKQQPLTVERLKDSKKKIDEIHKTGSLKSAELFEIITLVLDGKLKSTDEPTDAETRNQLKDAAHRVKTQRPNPKAAGRYENTDATVARTLPVLYYHGTGKLPASGHGEYGIRGKYIGFAKQACQLLNINISPARLEEYMIKIRKILRDRKS